MMMRGFGVGLLMVAGCNEVLVQPNDGGGGGAPGVVTASSTTSGSGASISSGDGGHEPSGGGGSGGGPGRTVEVDAEVPSHVDPESVLVMVSDPDGTVSDWWTGDQLPVDAPVDDGDLVTFARVSGGSSASSYRVTPDVTKVTTSIFAVAFVDCLSYQAPMTLHFQVPAVDGANHYRALATDGVKPLLPLAPGDITLEVEACDGMTDFDLVVLASPSSNTDPLAFFRVDAVPYVPGSSIDVPVVFSTERLDVDIVVSGEPGTDFAAVGSWYDESLGSPGLPRSVSITSEIGASGTSSLTHGPLAIGGGVSRLAVSTPPSWWCELDIAWRVAPFDATPFEVTFGSLAPFEPTADGNVAIGATGDVGDVLVRTAFAYASDPQAYWELHEDPVTPYPLPAYPAVPAGLLPGFVWPSGGAEVRHIHEDFVDITGYAHFTRVGASGADGRALHRVPADCF